MFLNIKRNRGVNVSMAIVLYRSKVIEMVCFRYASSIVVKY